jgi:hypothetical protein
MRPGRARVTHVLAPHDDGRFREAALLDQYRSRSDGSWRVVVRYSTGAGLTYVRAMAAADCRHLDDTSVPRAQPGDGADEPPAGRPGVRPDPRAW